MLRGHADLRRIHARDHPARRRPVIAYHTVLYCIIITSYYIILYYIIASDIHYYLLLYDMCVYIYIYIYVYMCAYIYIYIYMPKLAHSFPRIGPQVLAFRHILCVGEVRARCHICIKGTTHSDPAHTTKGRLARLEQKQLSKDTNNENNMCCHMLPYFAHMLHFIIH